MTTADKKPGIDKPGFDGEWVRAKLLDVCDFRGGTQPPKSEWIKEPRPGYVRMLQIRDYSQDSLKYAEYVKDSSSLHKCEKTDIMLSRYGYIGQVFTGLEGAYNVALVKVVKKVSADTRYLFYYFESDYFKKTLLASTGSRATIQGFNKSELANAEINLPDKTTQKRIPKILELLDSLIEISNKIVLLLDDLVKSQFVEMFGDPIEQPKYQTESLGEACTKIGSGATPRGGKTIYMDNGTPFIRSLNVHNGTFIRKNLAYIGEEEAKKLSNVSLKRGDVLLNITGASVARSCVLPDDLVGGRVNQHVAILRANQSVILPCILNATLTSESYQRFMLEGAQKAGATREAITKQDLERFRVSIPPLSLQQQFADFVAKVDKLGFDVQQQIERLEILKQSLMQEYFG